MTASPEFSIAEVVRNVKIYKTGVTCERKYQLCLCEVRSRILSCATLGGRGGGGEKKTKHYTFLIPLPTYE